MDFELSSRTRRFFASMIDGVVTVGLSKIGLLIFGLTNDEFLNNYMFDSVSLFLYTVFILVTIIVFEIIVPTYIWNGQTIGKKILGIKVVKDSEDVVDVKTMTIRSIFYLVGGIDLPLIADGIGVIGFIDAIMIFRKDKKTLHDIIAKTKVVYC
jgi:uncharacterized RDD family membrane protein YckC